jgi:hypothetical protein
MEVSLKTEQRRSQETPMAGAIHFKKLNHYEIERSEYGKD